jgi:hypothetical protein
MGETGPLATLGTNVVASIVAINTAERKTRPHFRYNFLIILATVFISASSIHVLHTPHCNANHTFFWTASTLKQRKITQ